MKKTLNCLFFLVITQVLFAQSTKVVAKFGDVKVSDFETKYYALDSSAEAVVLYDYCTMKYEGDTKGDFNIIYKYHKRIRILNKNAFDIATVSIPLYKGTMLEERIERLNAATYTLEGNEVITTKIDKGSLFKDKYSKNYIIQKFTLPNLKEGCIIEYTYTLSSPFSQTIKDWYFQGNYPVLWSEYDIEVPTFYNYVTLRHGYHPFTIDTVALGRETYNILIPGQSASERSEVINVPSTTAHNTWAIANVPAFKSDSYLTTRENHLDKLEFQLSSIKFPNAPERPIRRSWMQIADELLKSESFGADINSKNGWLNDDIKKVTAGANTKLEKAKKIFEYVRDNFTCSDHTALYLSNSIKKTFQTKTGNVADINLLLIAMLKHEELDAAPVMLSTKSNGRPYETYPIITQYNYVIAKLAIDSTDYLLDASINRLGFGKLDEECYNGSGRLISTIPIVIPMSPNTLKEGKTTAVFIQNDDNGGITGSFMNNLGYYESTSLREKLIKTTKEDFFKELYKNIPFDADFSNPTVENHKNYEEAINLSFEFKSKGFDEDIVYLNPMFGEGYKNNPFKSNTREYPIEMPYASAETIIVNMDIPKGYKVEELPKSVRVNFNDNDGKFEYIVSQSGSAINLRCTIQLNKAIFPAEEYEDLRNFYAYIVKKQSEQIVLKKIK